MNTKIKRTGFLAMILLGGWMAIYFSACQKSGEEIAATPETEITAFDIKVGNAINSFIDKVAYQKENPGFKSLETISTDSALWYLESTFNYCYGFPNEFYKSFAIDTLSFSLLLSGSEVNMTDLTDKFNEMIQEISTTYHAVAYDEKGLSLLNLAEATIENNLLHFTVQVVTGEKGEVPPSPVLDGPFEDGDEWWYGEDEGKCEGPVIESDAAQQLMLAMNATLPDPEGNFYVINPVEITKKGGYPDLRRPGDIEDNLYDYYLFFGSEEIGEVELCLNRNAMNTYYSYLTYLLKVKIITEELNPSYSLINIESMTGFWEPTVFDGIIVKKYLHRGKFMFGIKVNYYVEAPGFPTEL